MYTWELSTGSWYLITNKAKLNAFMFRCTAGIHILAMELSELIKLSWRLLCLGIQLALGTMEIDEAKLHALLLGMMGIIYLLYQINLN